MTTPSAVPLVSATESLADLAVSWPGQQVAERYLTSVLGSAGEAAAFIALLADLAAGNFQQNVAARGRVDCDDLYVYSASGDKFHINCVDQDGGLIEFGPENMGQGQGTTITLPDPGTTHTQVVLTHGSRTINGATTFADALTLNGATTLAGAAAFTGNVGFYSKTPAAQPSAYTLTYFASRKTSVALTFTGLTDNTNGTADTTLEGLGGTYSSDVAGIRNNFADLAAAVGKVKDDSEAVKQLVIAVIKDLQALGLVG